MNEGLIGVDSTTRLSVANLSTMELRLDASITSPDSITAGVGYFYSTISGEPSGNSSYLLPAEMDDDVEFESKAVHKLEEEKTSIKVNKWKAEELYLKELEETPVEKRVEKYFDLKDKFSTKAAFFIDVARFFIEKNEKQFALQVLSNVAEMKLENPELLRMLANQSLILLI